MAFLPSYGTGFGYSGYPQQYSFAPTAFAAPAPMASAEHHEGSQAGEDHASQQAVSVSGFGADPNAALFYGQPYGTQFGAQPLLYPPTTTLVPITASRVRRPGYNERLIAWRNRQKAFNRYKKATKEAIKSAARSHNQYSTFSYGGYGGYAAPTFVGAPATTTFIAPPMNYGAPAAPFGATYISSFPVAYDQGVHHAHHTGAHHHQESGAAYPTFGDFSQGGASQGGHHQEAAEEPEIRGTQV